MKPNRKCHLNGIGILSLAFALGISDSSAQAIIYEPFDDLNSSLSGNTPGLGLTGTWSGQSNVAASSLSYGKLGYQGGRVVTNPGNNVDSCFVSPGNTLTNAGLMADGATLWFSALIVKHADVSPSTDTRATYLSIGTGAPDGFDRIGGNTGNGFTVVINQATSGANRDRLQGWNNNSATSGGAFRSTLTSYGADGDTLLVVGKITWGAFNATPALAVNDVFQLYIPDKDLNLGSPVSTLNGNFDQLGTTGVDKAFDTIGFAGNRRENNVPEIDEIRFGATSAAVLPLDTVAPVLVTTDNASGSGVQRVATFDEEVYVGTGEIRIVNETTAATTTITLPDPQVVTSGKTLTITPAGGLGSGTFHIEIDAGALTDRNLNNFAGISNPDQWEFTVDVTAPTVASFADNTSPKPILVNTTGRLVYTVTFDEAINPATVSTADFAPTAGSVAATVDSVTATANPAVFNIAVSTPGTAGTLTLEIVANTGIADLAGNLLDTTTAIPSDNTLAVNNPVANAGGIANDFQGIIASQNNANNTGTGEARYFHVSVNPANAGTGWYCANDTAGVAAAPGKRNYAGPVIAYKMLGNGENGNVTSTAGAGGEPDRITYTTSDFSFGGFNQQQMRLWTANNPGTDLATGAGTGATGFDGSVGNFGYADWSGAKGFVDISGLASGSVHIYYGSFSSTPTLKIILHDNDNIGADIVIDDAHSIAGGGNGDAANSCEYYLAEIDFATDGVYDVLEYVWTSPNGRGLGTVLTGPDVATDPFADWSVLGGATGVTFEGDANGDGVQDGLAFLLGAANPNIDANAAGILPKVTETASGLELEFDCLPVADRGTAKLYVQHSSDLSTWTTSPTGVEVPDTSGGPTSNVSFVVGAGPAGPPALNSVTATIDAAAAAGGKLFGRLQATE